MKLRPGRAIGAVGAVAVAAWIIAGAPGVPTSNPVSGTANVWVDASTGNDATCTRSASLVAETSPCLTFQKAYQIASIGDKVGVETGAYPAQTIQDTGSYHWTTSSSYIDFVATNGPVTIGTPGSNQGSTGQLVLFGARHVEFEGFTIYQLYAGENSATKAQLTQDIWMNNDTIATFYLHSMVRFKMTGGQVGGALGCAGASSGCTPGGRYLTTCPSSCEPILSMAYQASLGNQDVLFDGVSFHDIARASTGPHTSCGQLESTIGLTIRNSKFWNCDSQGLFLTYDTNITGTSWPDNDQNVLIENNWLDTPTDLEATTTVSFPITLKANNSSLWDGTSVGSGTAIRNWVIRNNVINGTVQWSNDAGTPITAANVNFIGNLAGNGGCTLSVAPASGVTWTDNLTTTALSGSGSCTGSGNSTVASLPVVSNPTPDETSLNYDITGGAAVDYVPASAYATPTTYTTAFSLYDPAAVLTTDLHGTARPLGAAYDAGAQEKG